MTFDEFIRSNFDKKIKIYANDKLLYNGIGKSYYLKCDKQDALLLKAVQEQIFNIKLSPEVKVENDNICRLYVKTDNLQVISYELYGGNSSSDYELETRICNHCQDCSLYKNGQCASLARLSISCPFSKTVTEIAGYRSKKGSELKDKYYDLKKTLPVLNNFDGVFWKVGDNYILNLRDINIYRNIKTNNVIVGQYRPAYNSDDYKKISIISKEEFTFELYNKIINEKPTSIFYNEIKSYQDEIIPRLKVDILKYAPELAKQFNINEKINYVGMSAVLKTLKPNINCTYEKYKMFWDGEFITILNTKDMLFQFIGEYAAGQVKLKPKNDLVVKIEDNDWVLPTTIIKRR